MTLLNKLKSWLNAPVHSSEKLLVESPLILAPMRERLACLYQLEHLDNPRLQQTLTLLERLYALDLLDAVKPRIASDEEPTVRVEEAGLLVIRGVRELFHSLPQDIQTIEHELSQYTQE